MEFHLRLIGVLLIILALLHAVFPKYLHWKRDLSSLSMANRQIMYVHSFFIALGVALIGLLCLTSSHQLIYTPLGKKIALGLALFWSARWIVQFFGYSSKLWRGKRFETTVHVLLALFWTYLSIIFIFTYLA
jgi:hypothetical protein